MPKSNTARPSPHALFTGAAILVLVAALPRQVQGQAPPLITDRPDFTESPFAVPLGSIQFEAGLTWATHDDGESLSGPEALVRWSPAMGFELRFQPPGFVDAGESQGVTDIDIGAKLELGTVRAWRVGAIASLGLPTGDADLSSGRVQPQLILAAGRDVGEGWSLGTQASVARPEGGGGIDLMSTFVAGRGLGRRSAGFLEIATGFEADGSDLALLHGGFTFSVLPTLQLDVHAALGLTGSAPDHAIGFGVSTRFD